MADDQVTKAKLTDQYFAQLQELSQSDPSGAAGIAAEQLQSLNQMVDLDVLKIIANDELAAIISQLESIAEEPQA